MWERDKIWEQKYCSNNSGLTDNLRTSGAVFIMAEINLCTQRQGIKPDGNKYSREINLLYERSGG